ncbi:MAG: AAC(3) family N-acetyltransferase [Sphaerochaeta sp.]|jgi:aminoglycoside N3'-acetyltransferase|nr:AAC(3) family N-acetyltransferase [Sphaerochaeta sp.]
MPLPIHKTDLVRDLTALGIRRGDTLNLKVSMASIGYIVGGPRTLIDALLEAVGSEGTLVAESFVRVYPLPLSEENSRHISDRYSPSYAGSLANAMIHHPGSCRSTHPVQSFTAIGRLAGILTLNHTPESYAYDILRIMAQELDARNLKIGTDARVTGVGTTHVAIGLLGLHQNRPALGTNYYDYATGEVKTFQLNWSGGCARGFSNFIPLYYSHGAVLSEGKVGQASSKITSMKKTLEIELETLTRDKTFFFCGNPRCTSCRSWDFSPDPLPPRKAEVKPESARKPRSSLLKRVARGTKLLAREVVAGA